MSTTKSRVSMASPKTPDVFNIDQLKIYLDDTHTNDDVLEDLVHKKRHIIEQSLDQSNLPPDYVTYMLQVLLKAVQCGSNRENVIELLTVATRTNFFRRELPAMLSKFDGADGDYNILQFMQDLVDILNQVLQQMPNVFTDSFGLVIILQKRVDNMLLLIRGKERKRALDLSEKLSNMRDSFMKRIMSYDINNKTLPFESHAPPEDFHNIPILPRMSDIFLSSRVFLRTNKKHGGYDNLQHYLDVQFRLYREDCISPLREGITQFVQEVNAGHQVRRLQDGRLYKNVYIEFDELTIEGVVFSVLLDEGHCKRIKWMTSRRLLYGSLVCLSSDNFITMYFAMVTESDRDVLKEKRTFKIVFPIDGRIPRDVKVPFTMVESTAYFEAYRHVLIGLQNIEERELPFERYIVDCKKDVDIPRYLDCGTEWYDLQPIITGDVIFKRKPTYRYLDSRKVSVEPGNRYNVNILSSIEEWPSADELRLDQSQFDAYHAALTQEFVLIQGPPGTGKTHVGLQIAKTLLHNKKSWAYTKPTELSIEGSQQEALKTHMLVVCYTNHALDQFMEGIVGFLDYTNRASWKNDLVRVGGRCSSESIEGFSLKSRRRYHGGNHVDEKSYFTMLKDLREDITEIKESLKNLHSVILSLDILAKEFVMLPTHWEAFYLEDHLSSKQFFKWLRVDETSLLQRVHKMYKNAMKMNIGMPKEESTDPVAFHSETSEETEAKKVENERRIEEDDFGKDIDLGLTIDRLEKGILNPKGREKPHFDNLFRRLLKQEIDHIYSNLKSVDRMSDSEVASLNRKLWNLSLSNRWRLYRYWIEKYRIVQTARLPQLQKEHSQTIKDYQKEKKERDAYILRNSTVIAMTTTGAARYQDVLKEIGPRIVIVEEAAEVLEAHIITALSPRCEHLILIGDHKQLEPKPSVMELAVKYNLSLSMFERMLNNGIDNHCLQRQHRMRPEISTLVRDIYPVLEDNQNVFLYDHVMGVKKDVFFISHNHSEEYGDDLRSYSNKHEANFIAELCRYLLKQGYDASQITILAAYTGQMFCIRDFMPRKEFDGVRSVAIDNFQGEENDIILLSLVRSNKEGKIGFMKRENRICVALSRAKKGLFIVGNSDLFKSACPRWKFVIEHLKETEQLGKSLPLYCQNHPDLEGLQVKDAADFSKAPEGGCELMCDFRLECGHTCRLYCHPADKEHMDYICKKPCNQICPNNHPCRRRCHFDEPCDCPFMMTKLLQCGHNADMKCFQSPEEYVCKVIVDRELPCGHNKSLKCCIDPETYPCRQSVTKTLKCSHRAAMECCEDPDRYKCQTVVKRTLEKCGHEAEMKCCASEQRYKCKVSVTRILPRCGHEALMECWEKEDSYKCGVTATHIREKCGHSFDEICWKIIPHYERMHPCRTIVSKSFPECRHTVDIQCHEDITRRQCKEIITKEWNCSHSEDIECWTSKYVKCKQKCLNKCERGHVCDKKCHFPNNCNCEVIVEKEVPSCGHTQKMKCHEDPGSVNCKEMVMKLLRKCGHKREMECSKDPSISYINCDEVVSKLAPCGHTQKMKCSQSPSLFKCKEMVAKINPTCGHSFTQECSTRLNRFDLPKCEVKVEKKLWSCEHTKEMLCFMSPKNVLCTEKVQMVLPNCGHLVEIECSKHQVLKSPSRKGQKSNVTFPACHAMLTKQLLCGHTVTSECCLSKKQTCALKCPYVLSCGHSCEGKCEECFKNIFHRSCCQPCQKKLICGHTCKSSKCGLCEPCLSECENYCPHAACSHKCFDNCIPCHKKCALQCSHYKCSRLCFEECDRPRCNHRCQKQLKCKHPCMGFCGDPCPEFCSLCNPDQIENFFCNIHENDMFVIRLEDCGHEFDAVSLDNIFDSENDPLILMRCPKCRKIIRWHPRYANRLKCQWRAVQKVKASLNTCANGSKKIVAFPLVVGGVTKLRTYLQQFDAFLYIQQKLHVKAEQLTSQKWAVCFMHHLNQILNYLQFPPEFEYQKVVNINQDIKKLAAVWMLLIGKFQSEDKMDGRSDEEMEENESVDESSPKQSRDVHKKAELVIQSVDDFIVKIHTFTSSNVKEVQGMLKPLFTDTVEVNEALGYPALEMGGVHENDWSICSKGHIVPADQNVCCECTTGEPWDQRCMSFLKQLQDQPRKKDTYKDFGEIQGISGSNRRRQKFSRGSERGKGQEISTRDGYVPNERRKNISLSDWLTFSDLNQHGRDGESVSSKERHSLSDNFETDRGYSRGRKGRTGRGGTGGRGGRYKENFSIMETVSARENTADTDSVGVRKIMTEQNSGRERGGGRGRGERIGANKKQEKNSEQGQNLHKGTRRHPHDIIDRNSITPEDKSGGRGGRGRGHRGRGGRGKRGGRGGRF